VGPAPLAASAQADAAAGDGDEHDDVEDEFEHNAENDAEHVDEVLKIFVVKNGRHGGLLVATLAGVTIITDADVDPSGLPAIDAADDDRGDAGAEGSVLSNASVQVSNDASHAGCGRGQEEIEILLVATVSSHFSGVQLEGDGIVLLGDALLVVGAAHAEHRLLGRVLSWALVGRVDDVHGECVTLLELNREVSAVVDDSLGDLARNENHRVLQLVTLLAGNHRALLLVLLVVVVLMMMMMVMMVVMMRMVLMAVLLLLAELRARLDLAGEHRIGLLVERKIILPGNIADGLLLPDLLVAAEGAHVERVRARRCKQQAHDHQNEQLLVHNCSVLS